MAQYLWHVSVGKQDDGTVTVFRNMSLNSNFSLSFLIWLFYLLLGVESYCCTYRHNDTHTLQHTTLGSNPLDEWFARWRIYLKTHNTHNRQTSMPPERFEPAAPPSKRPQIYALDRKVTGTGKCFVSRSGKAQTEVVWETFCENYLYCCTVHLVDSLIITQPTNALIVCHLFLNHFLKHFHCS